MAMKFRILSHQAMTGEYFTVQRKILFGWRRETYQTHIHSIEVSHKFGTVAEAERYIERQMKDLDQRNPKPTVVKEFRYVPDRSSSEPEAKGDCERPE